MLVGASFDLAGLDISSAPTEFRLFASGETLTSKGKFVFNGESASSVMAAFAESEMDSLPIDAGHGMVVSGAHPDSNKALGWFIPEIRNGELWASEVTWTRSALAALAEREYRYFSPAIKFNKSTRVILEIVNLALTNLPATRGLTPLVLDQQHQENGNSMNKILTLLGAADEISALAKVEVMVGKVAELLSRAEAAEEALSLERSEREKDRKSALILELSTSGKLPPSQREFAESLSIDMLHSFSKTLTRVAGLGVSEPSSGVNHMGDDQRHVAKLLGLPASAFSAGKDVS